MTSTAPTPLSASSLRGSSTGTSVAMEMTPDGFDYNICATVFIGFLPFESHRANAELPAARPNSDAWSPYGIPQYYANSRRPGDTHRQLSFLSRPRFIKTTAFLHYAGNSSQPQIVTFPIIDLRPEPSPPSPGRNSPERSCPGLFFSLRNFGTHRQWSGPAAAMVVRLIHLVYSVSAGGRPEPDCQCRVGLSLVCREAPPEPVVEHLLLVGQRLAGIMQIGVIEVARVGNTLLAVQ